MKRIFKWMALVMLTPVLLFLLLAALLYLPPVQNWAVQKVAAVASEKTGMQITIDRVLLEWPLDLGVEGFRVIMPNDSLPQTNDTIANVKKLVADVKLRPLFSGRVVVNELSLNGASLNTNGFISDLRIKGRVGELWLSSKGIDLERETVEVNGARLADAQLDITLSDTAAVDTTQSAVKWRINADSITVSRTQLAIRLPGDTLSIGAYLGHTVAREADIDLGNSLYRVGSLDWADGRLTYDNRFEPEAEGLDYNHLAINDIRLGIDSISYSPNGTSLYVRQTAMKEKSGLEITRLTGGVRLDSTFTRIMLPHATLQTPDSDIEAEADMAFSGNADDQLRVRLNAQIGKQDLMRFMGGLPQAFIQQYPNHPLSIKGSVNGSLAEADFTGLDLSLPTAFHLTAKGSAANLTDTDRLRADIKLSAQTQNIGFLTALLPADVQRNYNIPDNISLSGTVKANGSSYAADLTAREAEGEVTAKGFYDVKAVRYSADVSISHLNLHHFMPKDSLHHLSADISVEGRGTDFLSSKSALAADATISQLQYGSLSFDDIAANATLKDGQATATLTGHNRLFDGAVGITAQLSPNHVSGALSAALSRVDLYRLRLVADTLTVGLNSSLDLSSDLKRNHELKGRFSSITLTDKQRTYHPEDIGLLLRTTPDTTVVRAQSGNLIMKLDGSGGYEQLLAQATALSDSVLAQYQNKVIDQSTIKRLLPVMKLHIESGRDNPMANILRANAIDFKQLLIDINTSPETGINGDAHVHALNYDSLRIDTILLKIRQKGEMLTYGGQITNNRRNPQFVFNALFDGHVTEHGALIGLRYFDDRGRMGIRLGASAAMEAEGIRIKFMPEQPTIGYKLFRLNSDNYVFLNANNKIQAKVDLVADDKTGVKIYSEEQDSLMLQDLTVTLNQFDLDELTSVIPYVPRMTGLLNGDFHIVQDQEKQISVVSDMSIRQMTYEGSPIGNLGAELDYLMREDDTHAVEARLMLDDEEFCMLSGTYKSATTVPGTGKKTEDAIDATLSLTRLPLSLVNGFVPDQMVGLEGYADGTLDIKGSTSRPQMNGELYVDSAYLVSQPYSVRMRFDDDVVRIVGSHLLLENFGLYAYNDEPLNLMGDIDFSRLDRITMDMRIQARDLLLIDSKQTSKSLAFGRAYVNFFARMQGPLESLSMKGRLDVLGSTDLTYMLLDSPLSTDNRLDELVKFADFSDTTQVVLTRPTPTGLDVDMNVSVSQGAHIVCNLNPEKTNYIDLMGGGDLRMRYNSDGLNLTGRYTLSNGEMKYSLPIIPLKTFTIKNGSYVEFTGDPMNPRLNITATERTKAAVGNEGGQSRNVTFDCGVVITKTLSDMGLEFIIEAPEDQTVNGELATMSTEERGKIAVTMLTTGMYLADGNTSSFSMNSALSSFLQGEINNIAGSALKTLDLSVGIDNTTDAAGGKHTDYSFKFAKRFMNNRLKIEIGGKVSSGNDIEGGEKQSFFDNVTMEYRLNQDATQNVKLFYSQNVYDWLEGYTNKFGGGFVWRRKLDNFWDILRFWRKEQRYTMPMRQQTLRQDTTQTDTIRTIRQ